MDLKIHWTDFAKTELQSIFKYYKKTVNQKLARKLVEKIVLQTLILSNQPHLGKKEPILSKRKQEFRCLIYKNYKIIYFHNKEKNRIDISDVFDTRQDALKLKRN